MSLSHCMFGPIASFSKSAIQSKYFCVKKIQVSHCSDAHIVCERTREVSFVTESIR